MTLPPRPTIRCAVEELEINNWTQSGPDSGFVGEVDHPIVQKAMQKFPEDRDASKAPKTITNISPTCYHLKVGRWRGAAYQDANGQIWIVAAGLRRGKERDDFYQTFLALDQRGGSESWLPCEEDIELFRKEIAHDALREWERGIWEDFSAELERTRLSQEIVIQVDGQLPGVNDFDRMGTCQRLASSRIRIEAICIDGETLGIVVRVETLDWSKQHPWEKMALHAVMARIQKGEQYWSVTSDGGVTATVEFDDGFRFEDVIAGTFQSLPPISFDPGTCAHLVDHGQDPMMCTIEAKPLRALCGQVFVPRQDFQKLPPCETCQTIEQTLKRGAEDLRRK